MKQTLAILFLLLLSCNQETTIIIDGVKSSQSDLNFLSSEEIQWQVTSYPGQPYPSDYKSYENTILIEVRTKKFESQLQKQRKKSLVKMIDSIVVNDLTYLIMLNGIQVDSSKLEGLKKLSSDKLKSVTHQSKKVSERIFKDLAGEVNLIVNTYDLKYKLE